MWDEQKLLPQNNPAEDHYVLHYSHSRRAFASTAPEATGTSNFKEFSALVAFIIGLAVWLSCSAIFHINPLVLAPLLIVAIMPFVLFNRFEPTNIEVTRRGIRLHYKNANSFVSGSWIDWDAVKSVEYHEAKATGIDTARCLDLVINTSRFNKVQKFAFELLCSLITVQADRDVTKIRLIESGFTNETDESLFRSSLKKFMPTERVSPALLAREEFGDIPTYTSIWFGALNSSTEDHMLKPGIELADGKYRILSTVGSGGNSVVYDCESIEDGRVVGRCVLKQFVLPMRGGIEIRKRALENVYREAKLLQHLDHPRIVKYKELFVEGTLAFMALEKIEGRTLRSLVEEGGPMHPDNVIDIATQTCEILRYLHNETPPVIHRDLTPENLIINKDGQITLIDFNVAHRLESNSTKTVVGKHAYVPPEQFRGRPSERSDIFALGATLYFLLTADDPEPLSKSHLPAHLQVSTPLLEKVVAKCTEPDEMNRYASIEDVISKLKEQCLV